MAWDTVTVEENGQVLHLSDTDGTTRLHAIWLRDNALDGQTRDPGNGQRLITMGDLPADLSISLAAIEGDTLQITFAPEGKTLNYPLNWLRTHAYDRSQDRANGRMPAHVRAWDRGLMASIPTGDMPTLDSQLMARV